MVGMRVARVRMANMPGTSRAEQKRYTRALILDAARAAVATRGFGGLAVREIAREAGIVPTAFYRHFESADALAAELASGAAAALGGVVDELTSDPAADPVERWPELAAEAGERSPETWSVLARGLVDHGHPENPVLTDAVESARRRVGIELGRRESLARADGATIDAAADLTVVEVLRVLVDVAAGRPRAAASGDARRRLRIVLAGAGA